MNILEFNTATQTKATQESVTPKIALDILKSGNERFVASTKAGRDLNAQVQDTSTGQYPFATVLSCIDSRVSSELIFDQGIGERRKRDFQHSGADLLRKEYQRRVKIYLNHSNRL